MYWEVANNMIGITRKQFINYAVFPGLRPRLRELFASGFHYIPYFIALVYQAVRLLPAGHPYTNPANLGRFGIRHVIAEAANNIVLSRKNIDQILLFITILFGLMIIFIQFSLFGLSLLFQPVMAAASMPTSFSGFFVTPPGQAPQDLAFIMLDFVFGVPGFFGSCVDPATGVACLDAESRNILDSSGAWIMQGIGWPFPIHHALHQMFQIYSTGLLVVAAFITMYFVITVIAETAQTGMAFGKRFNKVWAPVRIVVAFGLLIPLASGLNASQYLVLYAAKFGSGFATNGWNLFNNTLVHENYLGEGSRLVSQPNVPEISPLLQFMYVSRTCAEYYDIMWNTPVRMYLVKDPMASPNSLRVFSSLDAYEDMLDFADGATRVTIRFGIRDPKNYVLSMGNVDPVCGEITLPLSDPRIPGSASPPERGPEIMQRFYWYIITEIWLDVFRGEPPHTATIASYTENYPRNLVLAHLKDKEKKPLPGPQYKADLQNFYKESVLAAVNNPSSSTGYVSDVIGSMGALEAQAVSPSWNRSVALGQKGWAGAGIWYNKVAEMNGALSQAVLGVPTVIRYPKVMEEVLARKKQQDQNVAIDTRYEPKLAKGLDIPYSDPDGDTMASIFYIAFSYWQKDGGATTTHTAPSGNAFIDMINALLGTEGLYSMRKNADTHPLAQLVGVGRSLIESAMRNTIIAGTATLGGAALSTLDQFFGKMGVAAVGLFMTIAMIAMTLGFVLFYIIPFLPFIYFFFAVGGWIKGIFEAMVGAPLWALAHIRIDGNGLPGQAAAAGYYLIFEIFLRPILIVFGLLASISIFSALIMTLNQIWDLVTFNLAGFDASDQTGNGPSLISLMRGPVDEFFFTIVYTIIVYLMAMSSFKLIDLIPNNILRWMGQSVSTFNDQKEDPAQGLVGTAAVGTQQTISSVGGGLEKTLKGLAGGRK